MYFFSRLFLLLQLLFLLWDADGELICRCAGGWDEKFLQQDSELRRVRSEKANLEQHILGMESEVEALQEERTKVTTEMESQRKAASCVEQQMESLRTEVSPSSS